MKIESGSLGATWTAVMSWSARRGSRTTPESATGNRLRSIPMTGVMPEPAVTNSSFAPPRRQHELTGRLFEVDQGAWSARCRDQVVAHHAGWHRLDGDRDVAVCAGSVGQRVGPPWPHAVDVDADRTYWPGTWPAQSAPGRITMVAASAVSGWVSTMRPRRWRRGAADRSGLR